jgi:hypothetical protein
VGRPLNSLRCERQHRRRAAGRLLAICRELDLSQK